MLSDPIHNLNTILFAAWFPVAHFFHLPFHLSWTVLEISCSIVVKKCDKVQLLKVSNDRFKTRIVTKPLICAFKKLIKQCNQLLL